MSGQKENLINHHLDGTPNVSRKSVVKISRSILYNPKVQSGTILQSKSPSSYLALKQARSIWAGGEPDRPPFEGAHQIHLEKSVVKYVVVLFTMQ